MPRKVNKRSTQSLGPALFSRPLRLTAEERAWRRRVLDIASRNTQSNVEKYRTEIDEILANLRIINQVLRIVYHTPDWGNKPRIVDELIYILLSNRSNIEIAGVQFERLRKKYPNWERVLYTRPATLKNLIKGNGLEDEKTSFIRGVLRGIRNRFGRIAETDLQKLSNEELAQFLKALPGVGPKTADCVLMYTRQADVFPADAHCIRVLERLGTFAALGFHWTQEKHKQAQKELATLVPPGMRSDLHRNLIALGRDVCGEKPKCEECELKKFCRYYRSLKQEEEQARVAPTIIDIYAGPGGLSAGFMSAGFKVVAAIESDRTAARTLRLNHPELRDEQIIVQDARQVQPNQLHKHLHNERLDVLAGGPPCQGFSTIGKRIRSGYTFSRDTRNQLYKEIVRLANALQPRYVVIENVPGLETALSKNSSYVDLIQSHLLELGYSSEVYVIPVADFGVPQHRKRLFIIASHPDEVLPSQARMSALGLARDERPVLRNAIADLPKLRADDGQWISANHMPYDGQKVEPDKYLQRFSVKRDTTILWNHVSRFQGKQDLELFDALRPGEDFASLIKRVGRQSFMRGKTAEEFHDKYYRLHYDRYSKTIMSHLGKDGNSYVHPVQKRSLSIREAARIQSFPDDYIFCGGMRAQFTQIGNAVPPVIAAMLARILMAVSSAIKERPKREKSRCPDQKRNGRPGAK